MRWRRNYSKKTDENGQPLRHRGMGAGKSLGDRRKSRDQVLRENDEADRERRNHPWDKEKFG